jgi:transposase-like protein
MQPISYARHQFPPNVIRHAAWLYLRFTLSYRDVEELLALRGIDVSYESVRRWVLKFGPKFAASLMRRRPGPMIVGISTGWWSGSVVGTSILGARSIVRARSWTCWCNATAINPQH